MINSEDAVRTALDMIDADGLPAFSLEKLGRRLGVKGPSLYHHFADRADLLSRVARRVLSEVSDPWDDASVDAWDERCVQMTVEFRRALLRHPNTMPILLEHFPRRLVVRVYERVVTALEAADIPDRYHLLIFEGLEKLTLGSALYWAAAGADADTGRREPFAGVASDEFPAVTRAITASPYDDESIFEASCRAFLDGVKDLVASA